jgi:hypothetical protein
MLRPGRAFCNGSRPRSRCCERLCAVPCRGRRSRVLSARPGNHPGRLHVVAGPTVRPWCGCRLQSPSSWQTPLRSDDQALEERAPGGQNQPPALSSVVLKTLDACRLVAHRLHRLLRLLPVVSLSSQPFVEEKTSPSGVGYCEFHVHPVQVLSFHVRLVPTLSGLAPIACTECRSATVPARDSSRLQLFTRRHTICRVICWR